MAHPDSSGPTEGPEARRGLNEFVESRLTEERLDNLLDRLQGQMARRGGKGSRYRWSEFLADCWTALWVTPTGRKLVATAAAISAVMVVLAVFKEGEIRIYTPGDWQTASSVRLPDTLRFRLGRNDAKLEGKSLTLAGHLGGVLRSG